MTCLLLFSVHVPRPCARALLHEDVPPVRARASLSRARIGACSPDRESHEYVEHLFQSVIEEYGGCYNSITDVCRRCQYLMLVFEAFLEIIE